eukprot:TRINITY_DN3196_c0_g1_i6.p1 TRINITY_DN3196_c0_g1~~TRINITY_DN3196_c0_g1_i6.p1  ORF type:complete len:540 (+),score=75.80 TRINITY_DN3196_c0_g1_i6:45-1664(+)
MDLFATAESDKKAVAIQPNIFRLLRNRQHTPCSGHKMRRTNHRVYEHIVPNTTAYNIVTPPVHFKRFTPDGKFLLCISQNQTSLIIYEFRGYAGCGATTDNFENYFTKKGEIVLANRPSYLCKDFCLITEHHDFVIVASSFNDPYTTDATNQTTETREETIFHLIHIDQVKEYDRIIRKNDGIFILNHVGVSICQDRFAVLGLFSQQIALYRIHPSGKFIFINEIGKYCRDDDALLVSQERNAEAAYISFLESTIGPSALEKFDQVEQLPPSSSIHPGFYPVLMQRVLAFLYRRSVHPEFEETGARRNFHLLFNQFSNLLVVKMQFLDVKHLLIKFCHKDFIYNRNADLAIQAALLVVMNIETTQIIEIFENSSKELYDLFLSNMEQLRDVVSTSPIYVGCSSNNLHVRHYIEKRKKALFSCKNGGIVNAHRRIMFGVPCSPMILGQSPYFDQDLYIYDERSIVGCDKGKSSVDLPTKFNLRRGNIFKFQLDPTSSSSRGNGRSGYESALVSSSYSLHDLITFDIDPNNIRTRWGKRFI